MTLSAHKDTTKSAQRYKTHKHTHTHAYICLQKIKPPVRTLINIKKMINSRPFTEHAFLYPILANFYKYAQLPTQNKIKG